MAFGWLNGRGKAMVDIPHRYVKLVGRMKIQYLLLRVKDIYSIAGLTKRSQWLWDGEMGAEKTWGKSCM